MSSTYTRVILPRHPLLGRNVNHDPESRAYRVPRRGAEALSSVRHEAQIGILDQGDLGACTGYSGVYAIYRLPFLAGAHQFADVGTQGRLSVAEATAYGRWRYGPDSAGAVRLYSEATAADGFAGTYPPNDTGSDGLSIAKVLKSTGVISGYLWAFTLAEAVAQLARTPVITGLPFYESMFETDSTGRMRVDTRSALSGGHEMCVDELVIPEPMLTAEQVVARGTEAFVGGPNSWGTSWGREGRWRLSVAEWGWLLGQRGDVTAFVANTRPAPAPQPVPGDEKLAGDALWSATRSWAGSRRSGENARAAKAVLDWAKATGRG